MKRKTVYIKKRQWYDRVNYSVLNEDGKILINLRTITACRNYAMKHRCAVCFILN